MEDETTPFEWDIFNGEDYEKAQERLDAYLEMSLGQSDDLELLEESASESWGLLLDLTQAAGAGYETQSGLEAADHATGVAEDMIKYWTLQKQISDRIIELERGE